MGWGLKREFDGVPQNLNPDSDGNRVVRSNYDPMAGIQGLPSPLTSNTKYLSVDHVRWEFGGDLCSKRERCRDHALRAIGKESLAILTMVCC